MATNGRAGRWRQTNLRRAALLIGLAIGLTSGRAAVAQPGHASPAPRQSTLAAAILSSQSRLPGKTEETVPQLTGRPSEGTATEAFPVSDAAFGPPTPGYAEQGTGSSYAAAWEQGSPAAVLGPQHPYVSTPPARAERLATPDRLPQSAAGESADPVISTAARQDARLHDVCFVDVRFGWAAGDRGTIWHTQDGGERWVLQETGVASPLYSVYFLDHLNGWAVGGYAHPYAQTGSGVTLSTRDGGRSWQSSESSLLPVLKKVRFFDAKRGWAIGSCSALAPSGLFVTETGGRAWNPLPGERRYGWQAGDFLAPHEGALAGYDGTPHAVRSGRIAPAATGRFGLRGPAEIRLVPPHFGWLVGEGGLLMMTRDLGHTWQTPAATPSAAGHFDLHALAVRDARVWIAGSPGTRVFFTPDAGLSWQSFVTGHAAPLRAIHFADDLHGWAVGDFGTILSTRDGGQSWRRQRSGGTRAACLAVFAGGSDLPLELIARISGEEGYLSVAEIVGREDPENAKPSEIVVIDRIHEAVVAVGGSGAQAAWRFPVDDPALRLAPEAVIGRWDQANDGRGGGALLEAHLVRQIRTFRPEILITHGASPTGSDPLGHLLNHAVLMAVRAAGDPTSYSDQITAGGLEPWSVTRVFGAMPPGLTGTTNVTTSQLSPRLGKSLADAAAGPRGLIESRFRVAGETLGFRLLVDERADHGGREDFFSGIVLQPGGDARRDLLDPPARSLDQLRQVAMRSRNTQAILKQAGGDSRTGLGLLAQSEELIASLDRDGAARILHQMAQAYFVAGQWSMAASVFEKLATRYPGHPLTRSAYTWLVQYYTSEEAAWRVHGEQRMTVQQASARAVDPASYASASGAAALPSEELQPFAVHQASAPSIDPSADEDRREQAARIGKTIQRLLPDLHADPKIGFPLAVSDRKRGYPAQAERFLMVLQRSTVRDDWWACAQGERWMNEPTGLPPKQILPCALAPTKPHLDGRFDDAVWQRAKAVHLIRPGEGGTAGAGRDDGSAKGEARRAGESAETSMMLAYDNAFLYVALRCRFAEGVDYSGVRGVRPRNPDLSGRDRVELFLDLDRDFATYYRLTIDHRGFAAEDCWGDSSWDPTWFVAASEENGIWTAEAAIPLDQLTGNYPRSRSVWAVGLRRLIPGVGMRGWSSTTAGDIRPEEFGYLIFE